MAKQEVTGRTKEGLATLRGQFYNTPLWQKHKVPFEVSYCLAELNVQPEDYDGPQRWCVKRVFKYDEDELKERYGDDVEWSEYDPRVYRPKCRCHGGGNLYKPENLERPGFANLKHGMYAEDHRLKEDFSEADAALFDYIMGWGEIYGWPSREEDPARYEVLEMLAFNRVRSARAAEWFQTKVNENDDGEGEIEYRDVRDEQGVVIGEVPVPNTLSEDLRLLHKEIVSQMKELGLTPKSRSSMDLMDSQSNANDVVADLAADALDGDYDYDESRFDNGQESEDAADGVSAADEAEQSDFESTGHET